MILVKAYKGLKCCILHIDVFLTFLGLGQTYSNIPICLFNAECVTLKKNFRVSCLKYERL